MGSKHRWYSSQVHRAWDLPSYASGLIPSWCSDLYDEHSCRLIALDSLDLHDAQNSSCTLGRGRGFFPPYPATNCIRDTCWISDNFFLRCVECLHHKHDLLLLFSSFFFTVPTYVITPLRSYVLHNKSDGIVVEALIQFPTLLGNTR